MLTLKIDPLSLGSTDPFLAYKIRELKKRNTPDFATDKPDLDEIKKAADKFAQYNQVALIGNGGSRTSALAYYEAFFDRRNNKQFKFVSSGEPDVIEDIKKNWKPEKTLIVVISKSGTNLNSLEPLFAFCDYPVVVITGEGQTILRQMAQLKRWPVLTHPAIGGRFSGRTVCGLFPAALFGVDLISLNNGAREMYKKCDPSVGLEDNPALKLAAFWSMLEDQGYTEVYCPIYSTKLAGFLPLLTQLIHESFGKNKKGLTFYGGAGPETQHFSDQRFFGGRRNVIGNFITVQNSFCSDCQIKVDRLFQDLEFSGTNLGIFDGLLADKSMASDAGAVMTHALEKRLPFVELEIDEVNEFSVGEFLAFWQYVAFYAALLHDVDPFDQPEVERAKEIAWKLRKE